MHEKIVHDTCFAFTSSVAAAPVLGLTHPVISALIPLFAVIIKELVFTYLKNKMLWKKQNID